MKRDTLFLRVAKLLEQMVEEIHDLESELQTPEFLGPHEDAHINGQLMSLRKVREQLSRKLSSESD